jgi:hypothetical protein
MIELAIEMISGDLAARWLTHPIDAGEPKEVWSKGRPKFFASLCAAADRV